MMPALKSFDLVLGVDVHVVVPPPPAPPLPVPTPFTGFFFDPLDMATATVLINGHRRVKAGSAAVCLPPHIPIGGAFLKPPSNDGELFMGSASVLSEGDPQGFGALPVLTCQDVGMSPPPRPGKGPAPGMYLPTSFALPIPGGPPVLVGGAPTISMMSVASKVIAPAAVRLRNAFLKTARGARLDRAMRKASWFLHDIADKVLDKLRVPKGGLGGELRKYVSRKICTATGHPVDVATGKVFTEFTDLTLLGPLPFAIERVWYSWSGYAGPLGHGWHASFDMALAVDEQVVGVRLADGRVALFPALQVGASYFEETERITLERRENGYRLVDGDRSYDFLGTGSLLPLARIQDRNGASVCFLYEDGRLRTIVDSGGRRWSLRYSGERIAALDGPHPTIADQRVSYQRWLYDEAGNLVEAIDALGHTQRFAYRDRLLVRETLKNGLSFHFAYDDQQRCVHTWGDGGLYERKLSYDSLFQRTTVVDGLGHKTVYEHDGAMVHRTVDALGNETRTEYGEGYRVLATIDELGQRTTYEYDARGNCISTVRPDGATTKVEFERDLPVRAIDPIGGEWSWQYDARGREIMRRDALSEERPRTYGELRATIGATSLKYDARGNLVSVVEANGAHTRFEHDLLGRVVAVIDARGARESRTLDLRGRAIEVREPDGNVRTLAYDAEDNLVHAKDANSEVCFRYRGMGRVASRAEAGTEVRFSYDCEDQLTAVINEHGLPYRFELGPTGHVDVERGFDGLQRTYLRDRAGRVTRVVRPAERWTAYEYDELGRVTEVEHYDGSKESYSYRADGALLSASNDDASVEFERDALGRVLREAQAHGWVASEYEANGRVRLHSSAGLDQHITRDAMGDVLAIRELHSGFQAQFERDLLGDEVLRKVGSVSSRWTRDRMGRPLEHVIESPGRTLRAVGYRWAPNDRLQTLIDSDRGPTRFRHDARGYLALAHRPDGTTEARLPDAVGNLYRTESRDDRKYGQAGELLWMRDEQGETHCTYDPEGNLQTKRDPDGSTWHYEWNGAGMLRAVTRPDGARVELKYDALARRIAKTFRGITTRWLWDGDVPLHEWVEEARAKPGKPITWLFEPESFSPLARLQDAADSIHCDHLGTPLVLTNAAGERSWSAEVDTYGALANVEGSQSHNPFRWPGQYEDVETGLYYNRFRYYAPELGLYPSRDPIRLAGGLAMLGYVRDPLSWLDPLGLNGTPALPPHVVLDDGNLRIVHYYSDLTKEHADPIHFHVLRKGQPVAKIKADGHVLDGESSASLRNLVARKGGKTRLRRAEKKIAAVIRALGGMVGGRAFNPGSRGGGCGKKP